MKILKRIVLSLLGLFLVLLLVVAGAVYWVVKNPHQAFDLAQKKFFPEDLKITWQTVAFNVDHISGLNFKIDFHVTGLDIKKGKPQIHIPAKEVHVLVSLYPRDVDKKFTLDEVQVIAPETLEVRLEKPAQKEPDKNPYQTLQNVLTKAEKFRKWAEIENVDISIARLRFASGDAKALAASFEAHQHRKSASGDIMSLASKVDLPGEKPLALSLTADLKVPALGTKEPFLHGKLRVHGDGVTTEQTFTAMSEEERTNFTTQGQVDYASGKIHIVLHPELKLGMTPTQATTALNASFSGLPGPLVKVDQFKLEMTTPLEKDVLWSEKPSQFTATAPISLFFIDPGMRRPLEKSCECKIPEVLKFELKGQTWLANLVSTPSEQRPLLDSQLAIESIKNKLLSVDVAAKLKIDKKSAQYILTPALDLEASINNFQGFIHFLDAKNILIPAPLNLLNGQVKISSHDLVKTSDQGYSLPVTVVTALNSPRQEVTLAIDTTMKISATFKELYVNVIAKIIDLQLELPPMDPMKGKPRVTLDKRILKAPAAPPAKPSKFKVYMSIAAETTKPSAIRLLFPYFKPYLPITMSVHHSKEKDNTGFIKTEPFQIEYLRRKVQVVKMRIDLPESDKAPIPVDARFKIKQTQYTVFIDLVGPIDKPDIKLSSEPYLPESEIISVLLYDRLSTELAGSDAETSGNVQAAMADRAVGLFGLWAFAATPIKSFSYNAVTKVYTATVALSDDVTAGIGTNWEEATKLELRKRVSKSWMLTAAWMPATQSEDQKTNLVLQWEKRF